MVASKFVYTSLLLAALVSAGSTYQRRDQGYNPVEIIVNGVKSGVTNAQQQVQSLVHNFQSGDGHPTADAVKAFITGLDGQIDNGIGVVSDLLSPVTFGLSNQLEGAILGPFFQSVTDGAEVAISNIVGMPIDAVLGSSIESLGNNMGKLVNQATQLGIDKNIVSNLAKTQQSVVALGKQNHQTASQHPPQQKQHRRELAILDGVQNSVQSASQSIDSIVSQLPKTTGTSTVSVAPSNLATVITSLDSQIDAAVGNINNLLSPYATTLTSTVSGALLNSFFESITNGANTVLNSVPASGPDASLASTFQNFAQSIQNASTFASKYGLTDQSTQLININHRIHLLIKE